VGVTLLTPQGFDPVRAMVKTKFTERQAPELSAITPQGRRRSIYIILQIIFSFMLLYIICHRIIDAYLDD
jgi:hypothetical protein